MNKIDLTGVIENIQHSHIIDDTYFDKANLVVSRPSGEYDVINLKFKKLSNPYRNGQKISLSGNIRSYSTKLDDGKNKVDIYVFTYFDDPDLDDGLEITNRLEVTGRICKCDDIKYLKNGKKLLHFILANNMPVGESNRNFNSYLPCVAWGKLADTILKVKDKELKLYGRLQSREYKKYISDDEFEIKVAHEIFIESAEVVE